MRVKYQVGAALPRLGMEMAPEQIQRMIADIDRDGDGEVHSAPIGSYELAQLQKFRKEVKLPTCMTVNYSVSNDYTQSLSRKGGTLLFPCRPSAGEHG